MIEKYLAYPEEGGYAQVIILEADNQQGINDLKEQYEETGVVFVCRISSLELLP